MSRFEDLFLFSKFTDIEWSILYKQYTFKRYKKCLEIGSSTVWKTKNLSLYADRVIGLELFPDRTPPNRNNVSYVTGDWQNLRTYVESASIDVAVACHVLEHVENDSDCINQLYDVLENGSRAFVTTPNRARLSRRIIEIFTGPRVFPHWEHIREYDYEEIRTLIASSRFEKWSIIPAGVGLHAPWFHMYFHPVPHALRKFAAIWFVILEK